MPMLRPKREAKSLLEMKSSVTGALDGSPIVLALGLKREMVRLNPMLQKHWER